MSQLKVSDADHVGDKDAPTMSYARDTKHSHEQHGPSVSIYYIIFGCLAVLTVATVAVSRFYIPTVAAVILAFMIAISKASLVVTFFMHLKYDSKIIRVMCVLPTLLTMVLLLALLPDIANHNPHDVAGAPELAAASTEGAEPAAEGESTATETENAPAAAAEH